MAYNKAIPAMPAYISLENFDKAEGEEFNVEVLESCAYALCDLSFGFTITHPSYTKAEWLDPVIKQVQEFHGEAAYLFLDALVNAVGMSNYECSVPPAVLLGLLQMAAIRSEQHRGVRS